MVKDGWGWSIFCWAAAILLPDDLLFKIPKAVPLSSGGMDGAGRAFLRAQGTEDLTKDEEEETLSVGDPKDGLPLTNATDSETSMCNCILSPGPHAGSAATPTPNGSELGDEFLEGEESHEQRPGGLLLPSPVHCRGCKYCRGDADARVCLSMVLGSTGVLPFTSAIKPQL